MGTNSKYKPALAVLLWLGCLLSVEANATSLEITPVAIHLVPGQNSTTIEVMNRGGLATAIQLRAYAWSQNGDQDVLVPTHEVILSPPIFTVPSGKTQTIRLLLRRESSAAGQRSYRLLLDEVPSAAAKDRQVMIAMRVSLPVIIASASPKPKSLVWCAKRGAGSQIVLSATNSGNVFDRIYAIAVTLADGSEAKIASTAANSYLLAGAERHWIVQGKGAPRELRLSVTTQAGKSEQVLAVAP
jgi:fimbrial chaperone protein